MYIFSKCELNKARQSKNLPAIQTSSENLLFSRPPFNVTIVVWIVLQRE